MKYANTPKRGMLIVTAKGDRIIAVRLASPAEPSGNTKQLAGVNPPNVKRETRYDWSDAEDWERFRTTDGDGTIVAWSVAPSPNQVPRCTFWARDSISAKDRQRVVHPGQHSVSATAIPNWRESIEARPAEPFGNSEQLDKEAGESK